MFLCPLCVLKGWDGKPLRKLTVPIKEGVFQSMTQCGNEILSHQTIRECLVIATYRKVRNKLPWPVPAKSLNCPAQHIGNPYLHNIF